MIGKSPQPGLSVPRHGMSRFPRSVAPKSSGATAPAASASSRNDPLAVAPPQTREEIMTDSGSAHPHMEVNPFVVPTILDEAISLEVDRLREVGNESEFRLSAAREAHRRMLASSTASKAALWENTCRPQPVAALHIPPTTTETTVVDEASPSRDISEEGGEQVDLVDL